MDLNGMDQNGNYSDDMSVEPSLPLGSYASGVYGDPAVLPRVGDQYQVEIPTLISESEYILYTKNPLEGENKDGLPCDFLMGLPISIIWVNQPVEPMKDEKVEFLCNLKYASKRKRRIELKVEPFDVESEVENMETDDMEEKTDQVRSFLVPGSCGNTWSDIEKASFLLGLYIFRKDFVQVKKIVESKTMEEILLFYHGNFYRSDEYWRWLECRKGRSRKCVLGQRLFSGLRQQELLSRLVCGVSEECQNAMMEVSKTFRDGKMSLEEYVFSLKAMVGMNTLVDAVGIGRGKQDLTGPAIEPSKANQAIRIRPEIPIGKACSSLSPSEIIKFLTGDYRLSKARSNDLFWEAVWPRLLARGWHSEQPSSYNYAANSKHSLVFLMPGVTKFSRRILVKGDHYFDSVTDVLNKVASEPGLLDLDMEENEGNVEMKIEEDDDDLPERRRHCYLQPRTPIRSTDVMAFTVVDTSLANGKTFELRDLKGLPVEVSGKLTSRSHSGEDPLEVSTDESDCAYAMPIDQEKEYVKFVRARSENGTFSNRKDLETDTSLEYGIEFNQSNRKNPKVVESDVTRKPKRGHFAPVGKRRRLTACSKEGPNHSMVDLMRPGSDTPEISENILSHEGSSQVKLSAASSSRDSSIESFDECARKEPEQPPRPLIDLNFPAVPPDFGSSVFVTDLAETRDDPSEQGVSIAIDVGNNTEEEQVSVRMGNNTEEEQVNVNSRRQSSRNRPPTARALEAFAHGFLTVNSRKGRGDTSKGRSSSRNSQRSQEEARGSAFGTSDAANGTKSNNLGNGEL